MMDIDFLNRLNALESRFKKFSMVGTSEVQVAGNLKTGFAVNVNREPEEVTSPTPPPTGACCLPTGECHILTEADCITAGGSYQGDGTPCSPNPCPFSCDGSVSVHAELSGTVSGTCDTGISFAGNGSLSRDFVLNSLTGPAFGTAIYCTNASENMELNETNSTVVATCGAVTTTAPVFVLAGTLLARITVAGDIYGVPFNVGDWVLLVGAITWGSLFWPAFGTCAACNGTDVTFSVHQVYPDIANVISFAMGGITTAITLNFSVS